VGTAHWNGTVIGTDEALRRIDGTPVRSIFGTEDIADVLFGRMTAVDFDAVILYQPERQYIKENDVDASAVFPKVRFIFSMVDAPEAKRHLWEGTWDLPFYTGYASGDQFFTSYECGHDGQYCHVPEDKFLVEVLDPDTE
jgi:hypothetical protein